LEEEDLKRKGKRTRTLMKKLINKDLIAPCGMNCALCVGHLREKNSCPGCFLLDPKKPKYCRKCTIKNCEKIKEIKYCSDKCDKYPCRRLKGLDKRYREKYEMSMIENLKFIKQKGINAFLLNEKKRWQKGNEIYCVHRKEYRKLVN
jgi:hypothetical protein